MIFLYGLLGIVVLILLVAALIGTRWTFERSEEIHAPVDKVWPLVNSLKQANNWNPWMAKDPNIELTYSGTDGQPGCSYSWVSTVKNVGEGSQTITQVVDKKVVKSRVDFVKPFSGTGVATLFLTPVPNGTSVSWKMEGSTPYPMNIFKLLGVMEKNMDRDFRAGLSRLKSLSEQ